MYGLRIAGYVALLVTPAVLLLEASTAVDPGFGALGVAVAVALTGSVAAATERTHVVGYDPLEVGRGDAVDAFSVVVGAALTYALSVHAGLGPVVASALVGLLVGALLS
ncbi:hypothetical protein ACYJ1Y_12440 [Natrialbaceae archaeon A-gly3]